MKNPVHGLENIQAAFPDGFDFYDHGKVIRDDRAGIDAETPPEASTGVAFSMYPMNEAPENGETLRTLLLAVFEEGLDEEIYTEIGNVIAGRFAGGLSRMIDSEVMITPPLTLKAPAVQRLIRMKKQTLSRMRYFHSHENKMIPIDVLILRVEGEAKGHA